jgi:hypothetical protein
VNSDLCERIVRLKVIFSLERIDIVHSVKVGDALHFSSYCSPYNLWRLAESFIKYVLLE